MATRTPFAQRVITALLFGLVLLTPIFIGKITGLLIIGVLCGLTVVEYLMLQGLKGRNLYINAGIAVFMYLSLSILVLKEGIIFPIQYGIYLGVAFALLLVWRLYKHINPFSFQFQAVPATLYIALPLALLYAISQWEGIYRPGLVVALLLLVWTNDIMAYLIGRRWGKRIFAPVVSPKKTWEGTIAGWLSCVLMAIVLYKVLDQFALLHWLILGLLVGIAGSLGDLVESLFKRKKQIKDSGTFLPGHGGFMDRLDSLLFSLPFVALFFLLIS